MSKKYDGPYRLNGIHSNDQRLKMSCLTEFYCFASIVSQKHGFVFNEKTDWVQGRNVRINRQLSFCEHVRLRQFQQCTFAFSSTATILRPVFSTVKRKMASTPLDVINHLELFCDHVSAYTVLLAARLALNSGSLLCHSLGIATRRAKK